MPRPLKQEPLRFTGYTSTTAHPHDDPKVIPFEQHLLAGQKTVGTGIIKELPVAIPSGYEWHAELSLDRRTLSPTLVTAPETSAPAPAKIAGLMQSVANSSSTI